jgi:hypothetical protein
MLVETARFPRLSPPAMGKAFLGQIMRGIAAVLREKVSEPNVRHSESVKADAGEASASPLFGLAWQSGGRRRRAKVGLDADGRPP